MKICVERELARAYRLLVEAAGRQRRRGSGGALVRRAGVRRPVLDPTSPRRSSATIGWAVNKKSSRSSRKEYDPENIVSSRRLSNL